MRRTHAVELRTLPPLSRESGRIATRRHEPCDKMLRGKVDSAEAKSRVAVVTQAIDGVRDVKNELQVVPPSQRSRVAADDKIIAKNVESKLERDPQLKNAEVHVDDGVVALTGDVETIEASARASELARGVAGVRYVKNDLTFDPPIRSR